MSFKEKQLGDFALEKKLGAGGMGEVYRARQISLDRIVAVKILPKSLAAQENFIERFQREAKAAANLIHPNVIQIYSIGVEAGTPYFAMEYVEGEDLQQRMKRVGRLPYEESVEIIAGVANALACAYEKGIVHRDIKPSNIMLDKNGVVKVMDFGLAKATQDGASSNLTQSGLIMGTPNYISPEQGKGEPIDSRSDIYSLGVVFYEMLTGVLPFRADTPAALIYKHAFELPEPPTKFTADVPPFLEEICLRMLAKDPRERYPNPKALLADLNEFRRNPEYYLRGGMRRTPAITGSGSQAGLGSGMGMVGSSSANAITQSRAGAQPQAVIGATSGFKRAETVADQTANGATMIEVAGPRGGGGAGKLVLGIVILAAIAAGAYLVLGPKLGLTGTGTGTGTTTGGTTGSGTGTVAPGKVIFPISKLDGRVPKGVTGHLQIGFDKMYLTYRDMEVDPREVVLVFEKTGYKPLTIPIRVTAKGCEPPLESIKFEFEPSDQSLAQFLSAKRAFDEKKYKEAIFALELLVKSVPDYPGAEDLLGQAKRFIHDFQTIARQGQALSKQRRWADAIEMLKRLPESAEEYIQALGLIREAELAISAAKSYQESFARQLSEGQFAEARGSLVQLRNYLPEGDTTADQGEAKVRDAERLLADAMREYGNKQWEKALEYFEALLKISPRHPDAGRFAADVRSKVEEKLGDEQKVANALAAAEKAIAEGAFERARDEVRRALAIRPDSKVAEALLERAEGGIVEKEIAGAFAMLDGYFREKKIFNLLERIDSSDRKAYEALQTDLQAFFAAPIDIRAAAHRDLKVAREGPDRATVEVTWDLELGFPEVLGSVTPASPAARVQVKQKVKVRKGSGGWLFASFEQLGEKNVQALQQ